MNLGQVFLGHVQPGGESAQTQDRNTALPSWERVVTVTADPKDKDLDRWEKMDG